MKRIVLFMLAAIYVVAMSAQSITQKGVAYKYNGKNPRTPLGGVYIKVGNAANGVISNDDGTFSLVLDNLKRGSHIGNVKVTKQGMMIFNKQAVDEWTVRKEPLCLILCDSAEFQKQKQNLIAIGESQAKKRHDSKLAELKQQNEAKLLQVDEYYRKLDSLETEYLQVLRNMDEYADAFVRIDESEVDTVAQRVIEMFNRGEIEEALQLFVQGNNVGKIDDVLADADKLMEMAEKAKQDAEKAKIEFVDAIKNQISIYKLREEWDKAKSVFKELADTSGDVDTLTEYADFCIERGFLEEAKAYYQKTLDKLRSEGNNKDKENKETELIKKLKAIK